MRHYFKEFTYNVSDKYYTCQKCERTVYANENKYSKAIYKSLKDQIRSSYKIIYKSYLRGSHKQLSITVPRIKKGHIYYINPLTGKKLYKQSCPMSARDKIVKEILE